MHDDVYQMYLEEIGILTPCTPEEEAVLLERVKLGDADAKNRLMEGTLGYIVELVKAYENQGLPLGDLVQEANMAGRAGKSEFWRFRRHGGTDSFSQLY